VDVDVHYVPKADISSPMLQQFLGAGLVQHHGWRAMHAPSRIPALWSGFMQLHCKIPVTIDSWGRQ